MTRMLVIAAAIALAGCTSVQRGGIAGALVGAGAGAGIGAAGGGIGVAIGAGAGAGAGALLGGSAGEVYEVHRSRLKNEYVTDSSGKLVPRKADPNSGDIIVRSRNLAAYEKQLALSEARNRQLISQNERLLATSQTFADKIGDEGKYMRIETTPEGAMQVSMLSEVLFDQGSAKIKEAIYPVLDQIGETISHDYADYAIAIEGHADRSETEDTNYRSPWELSAARSLAVLHYFDDRKLIPPGKMAVAGYGPHRPAATGGDQQVNRRVVITLMPTSQTPLPSMK